MTPENRTARLINERSLANYKRVDRMFVALMVVQWLFAIVIAIWFAPYSWEGKARAIHYHVYLAVFLGGAMSAMPIILGVMRPGWIGTRYTIAVAQMMWSALLIHLTGGRVETHFHVFGSLAFLAFYRDWKVLVPATVVVAADHLVRQLFWPESVYGVASPEWWRFLEHAGWVLFEDFFLVIACLTGARDIRESARQQIANETQERAAATRIQTSILPRDIEVPGLEAAARMQTADTVGGDFYDVFPVRGGGWIAIGDVAGHGVRAGLTMLQAQSALAALIRHEPHAKPATLWNGLNRTYIDNVRGRLRQDEHMTLSLLRFHESGKIQMVGAHEEIVVWRAATKTFEIVPVHGTWIGLSKKSAVDEVEIELVVGDILVLYTDGIIEAKDNAGTQIGIEGVMNAVRESHTKSVAEIRDAIFALAETKHDDASVMVFRYLGAEVAAKRARSESLAS